MPIQIKCRAWDTYHKNHRMIAPNNGDFIGWHAPSNWKDFLIVMLFIGLYDANGKEIYDEDILSDGQNKYRVWIEEGKILMGGLAKEWNEFVSVHKVSRMKVVGNIYENPEML